MDRIARTLQDSPIPCRKPARGAPLEITLLPEYQIFRADNLSVGDGETLPPAGNCNLAANSASLILVCLTVPLSTMSDTELMKWVEVAGAVAEMTDGVSPGLSRFWEEVGVAVGGELERRRSEIAALERLYFLN